MADTRSAAPKVTYATLAAGQTPEFNKAYDEAVERVKGTLGKTHGLLIGGREIPAKETFADTSPSDTRVAWTMRTRLVLFGPGVGKPSGAGVSQ